jgi:guanylate kinase
LIFVVSGPGGAGKGTVVARLLEICPNLWLSRSWTTRPRRPGEAEDAYVFVDEATFLDKVASGGFLEWTRFSGTGHLYGTPTLEAPTGDDVLLEIELDGAQQVKALHPDAVLVLITAPTIDERERRLRKRGEDDESVRRRLEVGSAEEKLGRAIADHVVVNNDAERAAREVAAIIKSYRA